MDHVLSIPHARCDYEAGEDRVIWRTLIYMCHLPNTDITLVSSIYIYICDLYSSRQLDSV